MLVRLAPGDDLAISIPVHLTHAQNFHALAATYSILIQLTKMRQYVLVTPRDEHAQPKRLFRANFENNVCKAIDQLSGICSGILADGVVTAAEAACTA